MELKEIYTELIAEYSKSKEHKHHLAAPTQILKGKNPSCGDEISLELELADGKIKAASFTGAGCAISQASAAMMVDLIQGESVAQAQHLAALFLGMIKGDVTDEEELAELEDAMALKSMAHLPGRVKCAGLSWHTLADALQK